MSPCMPCVTEWVSILLVTWLMSLVIIYRAPTLHYTLVITYGAQLPVINSHSSNRSSLRGDHAKTYGRVMSGESLASSIINANIAIISDLESVYLHSCFEWISIAEQYILFSYLFKQDIYSVHYFSLAFYYHISTSDAIIFFHTWSSFRFSTAIQSSSS